MLQRIIGPSSSNDLLSKRTVPGMWGSLREGTEILCNIMNCMRSDTVSRPRRKFQVLCILLSVTCYWVRAKIRSTFFESAAFILFFCQITPPLDVESVSQTLKEKNILPSALKFGFLGLGIMGSGIVKNLLNSGHSVIVWNRSPDKVGPIAAVFCLYLKCWQPFVDHTSAFSFFDTV